MYPLKRCRDHWRELKQCKQYSRVVAAAASQRASMVTSAGDRGATSAVVLSEALYFYSNGGKKWSKRFVRINENMLLMYYRSHDSQPCGGIDLSKMVTNIYSNNCQQNDDIGGYQFELEYGATEGMGGLKKFLYRATTEQQLGTWVQLISLISSVPVTVIAPSESNKENNDYNQSGSSSPLIAKSKALIAKLSSLSPLKGLTTDHVNTYNMNSISNLSIGSSSNNQQQLSDMENNIITPAQFDALRTRLNMLEKMNSTDVLPSSSSSSSSKIESTIVDSVADSDQEQLLQKIIKIAAIEISHERAKQQAVFSTIKKHPVHTMTIICMLLFGGFAYDNFNATTNLYRKNGKINKINIKYNKGTGGSNAFTELDHHIEASATTSSGNVIDEFSDIGHLLNDPIINEAIIKLSKRNQMNSGAVDARLFNEVSIKRMIHRVIFKVLMAPFNVLKNLFKLFT